MGSTHVRGNGREIPSRARRQPRWDGIDRAHGGGVATSRATAERDRSVAGVRITHPERPLYPESGITKLALATYFEAIAPRMMRHVKGRALTLVRCPTGIAAGCFYMKHSKVWAPKALERVEIQEKTKVGTYLVANSAAALVSLAQMDVLEIHTWNSRVERLEEPDRVVFDIDPGPAVQ